MKYLDYDGLQEFKSNLDLKYEEKVEGKGLSTNDFTTALKNKLDNIEEGATANEGTVTGITIGQTDYIPIDGLITLPDYPTTFGASGTNHSSGLVPDPGATQGSTKYLREDGTWQTPPTVTENTVSGWGFTKNSGTVVGAKIGANGSIISPNSNGILNLPENSLVLSDWEEDDTTADSYILNKPTIITEQQVLNLFDGGLTPGEDVEFVTLDDLETEVENAGFIKSEDLATVATSGSYNDLINKPNFARIEDIALGYTETTTGITNLDATLLSTALRKTAQTLTPTEQALVKLNLGITEYSASLTRNIIISTSEPTSSDGNDGDIWLVYES